MTHTELKHQILDFIKTLTGKIFIGDITIKSLNPGYSVGIEYRQYDPVFYTAELPDEEFLKFIKEEIRKSGHIKVERRKLESVAPNTIRNNFLSPYDERRINTKD